MCFFGFGGRRVSAMTVDTTEMDRVGIVHVRNAFVAGHTVLIFSERGCFGLTEKF